MIFYVYGNQAVNFRALSSTFLTNGLEAKRLSQVYTELTIILFDLAERESITQKLVTCDHLIARS